MKIVFFTNKCSHGAEILENLKLKNIPIHSIIIEKSKKSSKSNKYKQIFFSKELGNYLKILFYKIVIKKIINKNESIWTKDEYYHDFSKNILFVENFNDKFCEDKLKEILPDLIILGGSRIIKSNIIKIPKMGIINAHPGILPYYRGVDVIPWAILNGDEIGVTIHMIDEGVDTGPIMEIEKIAIDIYDDLKSLEAKAEKLAGILISKKVEEIVNGKPITFIDNPKTKGKQYYKMSNPDKKKSKKKLKAIQSEIYKIHD